MERLPSDHPAVDTARGTVERRGGTRRPCLRLPDGLAVDSGDVVRVTVNGQDGHAAVGADSKGSLLPGIFANRRLARSDDGGGENWLVAWLRTAGLDPGSTVAVDELDPGHHYGLRVPGDRVVYTVPDRPADSLTSIAKQVDRGE